MPTTRAPAAGQRSAVPAAAQGPVEDHLARRRREQRRRLAAQHGLVDELRHFRIILTRAGDTIAWCPLAAPAQVASSRLRNSISSDPPAALRMFDTYGFCTAISRS